MTELTVWRVEDHEGNGECQRCGKTGLRWVTYLSDGSRVGGECAKRLLGWAPTRKGFSWVTGLSVVAEGAMSPTQWVTLWSDANGVKGVMAVNGNAQFVGPFAAAESEFQRRIA
jgi:hypothetical protein